MNSSHHQFYSKLVFYRVMEKEEVHERPQIGVIDAGTKTVKFCVFPNQCVKEYAEHAVDVTQHTPQEGWLEQDPKEILSAIKECIEVVSEKIGGTLI